MLPPGGMSVVYVDGVVDVLLAAAERGAKGGRYLVSDTYATNEELARAIAAVAGLPKVPGTAPLWVLQAAAGVMAPLARVFGFTPLVAPGQLAFLQWQARVDASKAQRELGFTPTPLDEGVRKTVEFLKSHGLVRG